MATPSRGTRRCAGDNVLHPIGWDAFGLNAENAAIKRGTPPGRVDLREHRAAGRRRSGGWACRSTGRDGVQTCDPEYYRWTQWLFLRLFEQGLAYRKSAPVNWCPKDQTVLANEQVIDGALRTVRHAGRAPRPDAVVLQDHRLRAAAAGRRRAADRLARAGRHDAAELDRALRGRRGHVHDRRDRRGGHGLHDAARHAVGRDVLRVRGRAPGGAAAGRARWHLGRRRAAGPRRRSRRRWSTARPPTPRKACSWACTR